MSTQSAKNIIKNQLESVIARAKVKIEEEGRKKLNELKEKLPTPQTLMEKLKTDINEDSCSERGKEKFERIYNKILNPINKIEDVLNNSLEAIALIEEKIDPIINEEGPVGKLKAIPEDFADTINTLNIVVQAAPALLQVLKGPTADVGSGDLIATNRDKAIAKIAEYSALFSALPMIISFHIDKVQRSVKQPIDMVKGKLEFLLGEIIQTKAFLYSLFLQFHTQCESFENNGVEPDDPVITGPTDMELYEQLLQEQFQAAWQQFQISGNQSAWKRIFKLKPDFTEDYDLRVDFMKSDDPDPGNG